MELKTLKDFEGCDENGIEIDYSELREEAIKWIKHFRYIITKLKLKQNLAETSDIHNKIGESIKILEHKILWVETFFNIEDLK